MITSMSLHNQTISVPRMCESDPFTGNTTRIGRTFTPAHIQNIMKNRPLYEGLYRYGDMNWVKGVHTPILTTEKEVR